MTKNLNLFLFFILFKFSFSNHFLLTDEDVGLRNWLKKLLISVPDAETQILSFNVTLKNLIINSITLDKIILNNITDEEGSLIGVELKLENASLHCNGDITLRGITERKGNIDIIVTNLNVTFPFKLIKNETTGLVSSVDTTGLKFVLDQKDLTIKLTGGVISIIGQTFINALKRFFLNDIIKIATNFISDIISKKLTELFAKANNLILNGSMPIPLNVSIHNISDLRKSSLIDTVSFIINDFTGVDGPLNFNKVINIITNNTGIIYLHDFYNETISFSFNVSDKNNNSLGYLEIGLKDLNITDLNTWEDINALVPNESSPYLLDSFTNLNALGINISFSIKVVLEKEGGIVTSDAELYEEAELVTRLVNNKLWDKIK